MKLVLPEAKQRQGFRAASATLSARQWNPLDLRDPPHASPRCTRNRNDQT